METKFDNSVVTVYFDKAIDSVIFDWKTAPTSNEFREALNTGLQVVQETKCKNWIGDCTNLGAIDEADQNWSNVEWFPKALVSGISKMGVIVADDVFNQMSVDQIMSKVESANFESQYFPTKEKARSWISAN
jgi:hypothetical protein